MGIISEYETDCWNFFLRKFRLEMKECEVIFESKKHVLRKTQFYGKSRRKMGNFWIIEKSTIFVDITFPLKMKFSEENVKKMCFVFYFSLPEFFFNLHNTSENLNYLCVK